MLRAVEHCECGKGLVDRRLFILEIVNNLPRVAEHRPNVVWPGRTVSGRVSIADHTPATVPKSASFCAIGGFLNTCGQPTWNSESRALTVQNWPFSWKCSQVLSGALVRTRDKRVWKLRLLNPAQ